MKRNLNVATAWKPQPALGSIPDSAALLTIALFSVLVAVAAPHSIYQKAATGILFVVAAIYVLRNLAWLRRQRQLERRRKLVEDLINEVNEFSPQTALELRLGMGLLGQSLKDQKLMTEIHSIALSNPTLEKQPEAINRLIEIASRLIVSGGSANTMLFGAMLLIELERSGGLTTAKLIEFHQSAQNGKPR